MATTGNYYVNIYTGTIQQQGNSVLAKLLIAAGFIGPFATIDEAKAAFGAVKGPAALGLSGGLGAATGANVTPGNLAGNLLGPLFQSNLWIRVVEVLAGLVLLGIGVNALFKGKPLQIVTGAAGAAGRVVP